MMLLPINIIRKLQMSLKLRISIIMIFLLGGFVGIIGLIRVGIAYNNGHFSQDTDTILVSVQCFAAVLCSCLPTYRPIFRKLNLIANFKATYASLLRRSGRGSSGSNSRQADDENHFATRETIGGRKYNRFASSGNVAKDEGWVLTRSEALIQGDTFTDTGNYPLHSINVERTVDIV